MASFIFLAAYVPLQVVSQFSLILDLDHRLLGQLPSLHVSNSLDDLVPSRAFNKMVVEGPELARTEMSFEQGDHLCNFGGDVLSELIVTSELAKFDTVHVDRLGDFQIRPVVTFVSPRLS